MTSRTPEKARGWWRFTDYEIKDGYIRPADGAQVEEYDPWAGHISARSGSRMEPPYQQLLELVDRTTTTRGVTLNRVARDAILDWSRRFGLLGLVPHQVAMVVTAPRLVPDSAIEELVSAPGSPVVDVKELKVSLGPDDYPDSTEADDLHQFSAASSIYVRDGDQWRSVTTTWSGAPSTETDEKVVGQLVPAQSIPTGWSKAVVTDLHDGMVRELTLRDSIGRFFPNVPDAQKETYHYPMPLTSRFWQEYAEPVDDFVDAAVAFRDAASGITTLKNRGHGVRVSAKVRDKISAALQTLQSMTAPVRPILRTSSKGEIQETWAVPSLLTSFALMLQHDAAEGYRVVTCEACGEVFTTRDSRIRHCSEQCRWRLNKRAQRKVGTTKGTTRRSSRRSPK